MDGKRILIVNDDEEFAESLKEVLSQSGYRAMNISDPKLAVALCSKAKPDVILLDVKSSVKVGYQLADIMSKHSGKKKAPIVVISEQSEEELKPYLQICGTDSVLQKPLKTTDVIERIEAIRKSSES